jgi:hypothetical protein
VAGAAGAFVAVAAVSIAGYRQWNYVQHDNRFCTSCHLMQNPYNLFRTSAHATLQCHTCHEGHLPEQLHQMWLTLVEHPTAIGQHAQVPNRVCAGCHVYGDSTRWKVIAATAGHRIHLESTDPRLKGLQCVTCHGVSLHRFASVDQTCMQSGCHPHNIIRLSGMAGRTDLHCTTCHNFLARAPGVAVDSLGQPLTPRAAQCLGCHAMQGQITGLDIAKDPHHGVCGDCHNPHTQTSARDVSCTNAGCHANWRDVSFHVGVPHPQLCTTCHEPHRWTVNGKHCTRCHENIPRERPLGRVSLLSPGSAGPARSLVGSADAVADLASAAPGAAVLGDLASRLRAGAARRVTARAQGGGQQPGLPRFSHGDHRGQPCSTCHSSRISHGQLLLRSVTDCERCHHSGPDRVRCATCHDVAALDRAVLHPVPSFRLFAARATVTRTLPFPHARHAAVPCVRCHTDPVSRAPLGADCASCHASHHAADADCAECHEAASPLQQHTAADHTRCSSPSCHGARAAALPDTRAMCLVCHTAQTQHVPGKNCEACHQVLAKG